MTRHQWGIPERPDRHVTIRRCERPGCLICKVTRHEAGERPWQEFRRLTVEGPGDLIETDGKTPECEGWS